jgi:hypothetical protein
MSMVFHETVPRWGIASNTLRAPAAPARRTYIRRRQLATKAVGMNPDKSMRPCAARNARPPSAQSWKRWEKVVLARAPACAGAAATLGPSGAREAGGGGHVLMAGGEVTCGLW